MKKLLSVLALVMALLMICAVGFAEEEPAKNDEAPISDVDQGELDHVEYLKDGKILPEKDWNCKSNPAIKRTWYTDAEKTKKWYYDEAFMWEHPEASIKVTKTATCTEPGEIISFCKFCNTEFDRTPQPALGHDWSSDHADKDPYDPDDPGQWGRIIEEPTCTSEGKAIDYCLRCNIDGTKTRIISALPHQDVEVIDAIPVCAPREDNYAVGEDPFIIKPGKFHWECKVCKRAAEVDAKNKIVYHELSLQKYNDMLKAAQGDKYKQYDGHDWDAWVVDQAETCHKDGLKVQWCKRCGTDRVEKINAHLYKNPQKNLNLIRNHLVDCYKRYNEYTCNLCGEKIYGDFVGGKFVEVSEADVKANNRDAFFDTVAHTYVLEDKYLVEGLTVPATCTEDGAKYYKCIYCEKVPGHKLAVSADNTDLKKVTIKATGHKWIGWICEHKIGENGNEYNHWVNTCSVCGLTKDFNGPYNPEKCEDGKHQYEKIEQLPATCTRDGSTTYICRLCGDKKTETTAALGHNLKEEVVIEATCANGGVDGKILVSCTRCDYLATKTVKAPAHKIVEDPEVPAEVGKPGKTAGSHCEVCGEVIVPQEDIPALPEEIPNEYSLDLSGVTKSGSTSGTGKVILKKGNQPTDGLYARVTWIYTLEDGGSFAYCAMKDVVDNGDELTFKMVGPQKPFGASLDAVQVALVTNPDADASGYYTPLALASK